MSKECNVGVKRIFLKISGLAKLLGVDHLLPKVENEESPEIVKSFLDYRRTLSPSEKNENNKELEELNPTTLTVKAQYKGRKKPMKYILDTENE